ncbi:hypothetical protein AJ79_02114 [Helicocarpus griseus UAMH5409]|uniref:Aminotransferase class I/classII large domain-containing protein n=1 Tax=Helicocarpus griseus UAMH5409 TaxID=1447875 RepID=A0A2B7Y5L4_9EURO|nr:hypothetical protein AJ79_02114 [Helicocarpus griseus UAMH5409]
MPSTPPINLFRGWPSASLHPTPPLISAANTVLSTPSLSAPALSYGPDEGDASLRAEIARWLSAFYNPQQPITPSRICISGGASQNLACLLQVFSDPLYTKNVWMVAPTYYLACRIFEDAGFAGRLRGIKEDTEGVDVDQLERGMEAVEQGEWWEQMKRGGKGDFEPVRPLKPARPWRKLYRHIIYAVPTFSNPSSKVMSLRRREELVRLARKYDALIISDDVYDHLQWPASPPASTSSHEYPYKALVPRIVDVDRYLDGGPTNEFGNAVSNGSFSKIAGPGCRVGWAEGTDKLAYGLSQAGSSRSGGCPSQLTSTFIREMLSTNALQTHIKTVLQPAYSRRYYALVAAVREHLGPLGVSMPDVPPNEPNAVDNSSGTIAGGYFLWLQLPPGLRASELAKKAQEEDNLVIAGGNLFRVVTEDDGPESRREDEDFQGCIRLCFAWEEETMFEEGVKRLAELVKRELWREC